MIRVAVALGALLELALVRLLPETGGGLYLRLAAATIVLLLPGGLIADALGLRSASATLVWNLAAIFAALAVTFAVGGSLTLTLILLAVIAAAALPFAVRRTREPRVRGTYAVGVLGVGFGILIWHAAGHVDGDALFHLARVRKLEALDSLSLDAVAEFRDGSLHPGYAFPLWHGFLALVSRLAGVDPASTVLHEAAVLVPLAFLAVYEAGTRLFRSAWGGLSVLVAQVALMALAAGHGGAYTALGLPSTASRQLLVPAALALVFWYVAAPSWTLLASVGAAGLVLALVHPTYALFVGLGLTGFLAARALLAQADIRRIGVALAAFAVTSGAVVAWLLPVVRDTASHSPSGDELQRALTRYAGDLEVFSEDRYRLAPELFARGGAVAVAALVLVPVAALAWRRRWAAWVLGASLVVLALTLVSFVFPTLADAVSVSQARRAAGFLPYAFALAGGATVVAGFIGIFALPAALAAGITLQIVYPGDFDPGVGDGVPEIVAWIAAFGGAVALAAAAVVRRPDWRFWRPGLAAFSVCLFCTPVVIHGLANWGPRSGPSPYELSEGLVDALRRLPEQSVVFSDLETSYRIGAYAPVYVAAGPPAHVADTEQNRPYERRTDVRAFFRTGRLDIPRRYGAGWIVVDRDRFDVALDLPRVYGDARYVLLRLP